MILVSVIIPTFNRASLIARAINSVLQQTYKQIEIIVVDDGSTDNTSDIISNFLSKEIPIRYYRKQNGGPNSARNFGINHASGSLIALLDADDYWLDNKIQLQVELFKNSPNLGAVFTNYLIEEKGIISEPIHIPAFSNELLHEKLILGNIITGSASSIVIKRECFDDCGYFDEELRAYEDLDMWRRLSAKFEFGKVEEFCTVIVQHSEQAQKNLSFMFSQGFKYLDKLKREEKARFYWVNKFARSLFREYIHQPIGGTHNWNTNFTNYKTLWNIRPDARPYLIKYLILYFILVQKSYLYRFLMFIGVGHIYRLVKPHYVKFRK